MTRCHRPFLFFLLLLLSASSCHGEGYPLHEQDFVVRLTDETFEHETQASTGMTTGSWLVWIHRPSDATPIAGPVPPAEFWTEHGVVLATIDSKQSKTRTRFDLMYGETARRLPCLVFLHKGLYYKLPAPPEGYVFNWDTLTKFATESYQNMPGTEIPPPLTLLDEALIMAKQFYAELAETDYFIKMGYFFLFMIVLSLFQNVVFADRSGQQQKKVQAAAARRKKEE